MKNRDELVLNALEKEHRRLCKKAEKAKEEADRFCKVGSEIVDIRHEASEVLKSSAASDIKLKKLDALQKREASALKLLKKDCLKIFDAQHEAEHDRDTLLIEIRGIKARMPRQ